MTEKVLLGPKKCKKHNRSSDDCLLPPIILNLLDNHTLVLRIHHEDDKYNCIRENNWDNFFSPKTSILVQRIHKPNNKDKRPNYYYASPGLTWAHIVAKC